MTVRTNGDTVRTSSDSAPPRRRTDEAGRDRHIDAIDGDEPVLAAANMSGITQTHHSGPATQSMVASEVDPLFGLDAAADFRSRWDIVQRSFVDDPRQAVRAGDELVTQVIEALSRIFAEQRTEFEKDSHLDQSPTETLRLAFRRYRSFFERLLTM